MKKALIVKGGWDGHEPELVSARFGRILEKEGFEVTIKKYEEEPFAELEPLMELDLIVSCVTGMPNPKGTNNLSKAIAAGVGLAGCHGGMCDSYRGDTEWQFITGGQWVSHPGGDGVEYMVNIHPGSSPIVEGLEDFKVKSEHYYLHVDPSIEVLATTQFPLVNWYHAANKPVAMPVVWTKYWGLGRVFYSSLGHHDQVFVDSPTAEELMRRGFLWAAEGKTYVKEHNLTPERYENNAKMY